MVGNWIWHLEWKDLCSSWEHTVSLPQGEALIHTLWSLDEGAHSHSVFGARCFLPLPASASDVLGPATINHYLAREKNKEKCAICIWTNSCYSPLFPVPCRYPGHIGRTQHATLSESCQRHSSCFQCCIEHNSQSHCIDPVVSQTWTCFLHYFWGCIGP